MMAIVMANNLRSFDVLFSSAREPLRNFIPDPLKRHSHCKTQISSFSIRFHLYGDSPKFMSSDVTLPMNPGMGLSDSVEPMNVLLADSY